MGHVRHVTLALMVCLLVSIIGATDSTDANEMFNCKYQQFAEDRYSWEKPQYELYRTIDPKDIDDPSVGTLQVEDLAEYKAGIETMDLSVLKTRGKSNEEHTDSSVEATDAESRILQHYQIEPKEEKTITIVKNVKVPYAVEKIVRYPVVKKVPYPIEIAVPEPYPIEKPIPYPVKVMIKVPVGIPRPVPVYKAVHYAVHVPIERRVPYPVYVPEPFPVERKVHYEVKVPVPQPFPIERNVPVAVKMPIAVPQPYPVDKPVHYPVEVKVDRPIAIPVSKPYPVTVIKPVPYPVAKPRLVPYEVKVERPIPVPVVKPVPYPVKVPVHQPYPVEKKVPYSVVKHIPYKVEVPVERPVLVYIDKHISNPVKETHENQGKFETTNEKEEVSSRNSGDYFDSHGFSEDMQADDPGLEIEANDDLEQKHSTNEEKGNP